MHQVSFVTTENVYLMTAGAELALQKLCQNPVFIFLFSDDGLKNAQWDVESLVYSLLT